MMDYPYPVKELMAIEKNLNEVISELSNIRAKLANAALYEQTDKQESEA